MSDDADKKELRDATAPLEEVAAEVREAAESSPNREAFQAMAGRFVCIPIPDGATADDLQSDIGGALGVAGKMSVGLRRGVLIAKAMCVIEPVYVERPSEADEKEQVH